ncbi:MAG: hypothetical protein HKN96_09495, partial [Flavobacteriaceae bacterium]|nr:hypothetical protein [Flavobacteriaceae bacterium]
MSVSTSSIQGEKSGSFFTFNKFINNQFKNFISLIALFLLPLAVSAQCPSNYQCVNHALGHLEITFELEAAGAAADQNLACQFVERMGGTINPSDDTDCSGGSFTIGTTTYSYVGDDGGGNTPITLTFTSGVPHNAGVCPADYAIAEAIGCGQTADNGCLSIIFQDTETTNNCTSSNGYLSIILDLDSNDDGTDDCGPYTLQTSGTSPIDFNNPSIFQYTSGTYNDATAKADVYIFKFTDVNTLEEYTFLYDFRAQFGTCPADAPVLFIDKSIIGSNTYSLDGDIIYYQYAVTSTENITDVVVRDDKIASGFATYDSGDDGDNILEVGETWYFIASYQIVAPDDISAGSVVNIARATGEDSNGIPVLSEFDSETATYVPCVPPSITTQPTAQEVCAGDSASFSVVDTGTSPTYQWQENGVDLANGGVYSGVDLPTLNISDATGLNGNMYQVIITEGCSTTSNSVTLTVNDLPTVTFTAPADICEDEGIQSGLGGGTPTGGLYSGLGVIDGGDGINYSFDPAVAGVGTHTITYTFIDAKECSNIANDDIEVLAEPATVVTPITICSDEQYT